MKKGILIAFLFLFTVTANCYAVRELTLDDLYRLALENSETIKISEEDLSIAELEKNRARSAFIPTLSAFVYHTRYTEAKDSRFGLLQPDYSNEWGLRLDQSFSLGGQELTAYNIAREGIRKGRYDLVSVKENYLLEVALAYYGFLKSKKAFEIAASNVKRLTKHRDSARTRLEVGSSTKTTLLRAEAELAGAQSEMIRAENILKLTKSVLARTAEIRGDFDIKETSEDNLTEADIIRELTGVCDIVELDCVKNRALSARAEIKSLSTSREMAEKEIKFKKGSFWPNLSLEGVYFREKNSPSRSFELNERIYGAVKLDFPLFEGGLRVAEVGQAKAKLRQAEHTLTDVKDSINIEVEDAYLNLKTVSSMIKQLESEVAFATDNFNSLTKQFQYGLANSVDVMDANNLLVTAERKLASARYDYRLAALQLRRATGTLLDYVNLKNADVAQADN